MVHILALKKNMLIFIVLSTQCLSYVWYSVFIFCLSTRCLFSVCPLNVYSMATCSIAYSMFARSMLILLFNFYSLFSYSIFILYLADRCLFSVFQVIAYSMLAHSMLNFCLSTQCLYSLSHSTPILCLLDAHSQSVYSGPLAYRLNESNAEYEKHRSWLPCRSHIRLNDEKKTFISHLKRQRSQVTTRFWI
jgi:hypothetical protein